MYPYFKMLRSIVQDAKLTRIAHDLGLPRRLVLGTIVDILQMASDAPERGTLPTDKPAVFGAIGNPPEEAEASSRIFAALQASGYISENRWTHWEEEQDPKAAEARRKAEAEKRQAEEDKETHRRELRRLKQQRYRARKNARKKAEAGIQPGAQSASAGKGDPASPPASQPLAPETPLALSGAAHPAPELPAAEASSGAHFSEGRGRKASPAPDGTIAGSGRTARPPMDPWIQEGWEAFSRRVWIRNAMKGAAEAWSKACACGEISRESLPQVLRSVSREKVRTKLRRRINLEPASPPGWIRGCRWEDEDLNGGWKDHILGLLRRAKDAEARKTGTAGAAGAMITAGAGVLSAAGEQTRQSLAAIKQAWKNKGMYNQEERHVDVSFKAAAG